MKKILLDFEIIKKMQANQKYREVFTIEKVSKELRDKENAL